MVCWELQERPRDKPETSRLSTRCWAEGSRRHSGQVWRQESGGSGNGWPGAWARQPPARRGERDAVGLRGHLLATAGTQEVCHSPHGVGRASGPLQAPRPVPRTSTKSPVLLRPAVCPAAASWRVVIDLRRSAGAPAPLGPWPTADGSGQVAGRGWGAPSPLSSHAATSSPPLPRPAGRQAPQRALPAQSPHSHSPQLRLPRCSCRQARCGALALRACPPRG